MERYDVAIAGAGVAGLHLARELARRGRRVVVVERKSRDNLGHDWWDGLERDVFPEVGLPAPEPPERMRDSGVSKILTPRGAGPIYSEPNPHIFIIDRKLFARRQLVEAESAGAKVIFDTAVRGPLHEGGAVAGLLVRPRGGADRRLQARLTVDASGVAGALRSRTRSYYGFPRHFSHGELMVTYREIRENITGNRDTIYYIGERNQVHWINYEQNGMIDFFAGAINMKGRPSPSESVSRRVKACPDVGGQVLRGGSGAPIPVRHCFDSFVAPGLLLCGDSASQCSPLNGSGMASSLRAASAAAGVINKALESGRADLAVLWPYNAAYKRTQGARFISMQAFQLFLIHEDRGNVEQLFRHEIVSLKNLRGAVDVDALASPEKIVKLIRLADRPLFLYRLAVVVDTARKLVSLYREYPAKYDMGSFRKWVVQKNRLLKRIPALYGR